MPTADYSSLYRTITGREPGKPILGTTTIGGAYISKDKSGALMGWAYKTGKAGKPMRETVEAAADIGTAVHAACAMLLLDKPDYESPLMVLKPDLQDKALNSVLGFLEWKKGSNVTVDHVEEPMVSVVHGFGGCPDYIGHVSSTRSVIELKTGSDIYDEFWMQVKCYGMLWDELHTDDPIRAYHIINIKKDTGGFVHAYRPDLPLLFEKFLLLKQLVELDKQLAT